MNQTSMPAVVKVPSDQLLEKGDGLRFDIPQLGPHATGFVVRFEGQAHAYVNRCAHVPIELDWQPGKFFNLTQDYLLCATHGAMYTPQDGHCVMGPCAGRGLSKIHTTEQAGWVLIHLDRITSFDHSAI